ncbi:MAG: PT domain-containing protein [Spirochaetales bacterium]|nr:PT domain-containing protein [Spirochaetales bacterium]
MWIFSPRPNPHAAIANEPTNQPTTQPTNQPTNHPTNEPTNQPTTQLVDFFSETFCKLLDQMHNFPH